MSRVTSNRSRHWASVRFTPRKWTFSCRVKSVAVGQSRTHTPRQSDPTKCPRAFGLPNINPTQQIIDFDICAGGRGSSRDCLITGKGVRSKSVALLSGKSWHGQTSINICRIYFLATGFSFDVLAAWNCWSCLLDHGKVGEASDVGCGATLMY
jgi:hypothetical protein